MYSRTVRPLKSKSFFLFGARGTGKSTYLKLQFFNSTPHHYIDLLLPELEDRYQRSPQLLKSDIFALKKRPEWVVIDEIQKLPRLLDLVHHLIEETDIKFALTGSSARKLKRGNANLLAGRANWYHLFPLTAEEIGEKFNLENALNWGTLPEIFHFESDEERSAYLKSYTLLFIKEEIQVEQLVRNLDPFREFLEIAAQSSGKIINYSKIGREVGVDTKTVQNYFQILEDTLIGFILPSYHKSIRKSQLEHPKFYLFDNGVKNALSRTLRSRVAPGTSSFGNAFEHWVLQEVFRTNLYQNLDFRLNYFATKNGTEIDLILTRGAKTILVEIKSSDRIDLDRMKKLGKIALAFKSSKAYYVSRDKVPTHHDGVDALSWEEFVCRLHDDRL